MENKFELVDEENARIESVYRQRDLASDKDLYAPWQPAEILMVSERKRVAAEMLFLSGKFPKPNEKCLEIGYGKLGWLADLISWGLRETDLYGIELNAGRAIQAQRSLPGADLRIGDATKLPWDAGNFNFVVASTVFSSILNEDVCVKIAEEIKRVLPPGGVLIWYDLAVNNPRNPDVRGIPKKHLAKLFPEFEINTKSVTLAPPLARFITPKSFAAASILCSLPFLRTHLLGTLIKK
jgi:ubiquinone/menaquinone biosynthesis C-methylase UbiE